MPDFGRWTSNGGDPSLNEINRADRFLDALSSKQQVYSTDRAEAELAYLLSDWRDEVRDSPTIAPVGLQDAVVALQGGRTTGRGSRRSFAVVGSVAAAMLCIGGFGTAVYGAGPGDSLYGMRTELFGQEIATRNDRVELASAQLQQVQQLIDNGQWQEAQDKLVAVSSTVKDVGPVEQHQQLVDQWNALTYKVVEQDPAATLPPAGEPLPALPSSPLTWLPAPVADTPSSTTSTSTSSTTSTTTSPSSDTTTPPSESSTSVSPSDTPSTTAPSAVSTSAPSAVPPPGGAPPSSVTTSASTSASPPSSSPPSSTPTTTTPSTPPSTSTSTSASVAPPAAQPPPVSEPPASAPRLAPSAPVVQAPVVQAPVVQAPVVQAPVSVPASAIAPVAPSQPPVAPPVVAPAPEPRVVAPTPTTTVVPQPGGERANGVGS